jgi:hypothetical protein
LSDNNPIVGSSSGAISDERCIDCYNDRESSGVSDIDFAGRNANFGVTNLSTVEAQTLASYVNWSIADISTYTNEAWAIDDGNAYPILAWSYSQLTSGIITYGDGPNMGDPVEGANVVYLQIDDDSFANAIVLEQVVTGADGRHILTETVPDGKLVAFMSHKKETDGTYFSTPPKILNRYLPE